MFIVDSTLSGNVQLKCVIFIIDKDLWAFHWTIHYLELCSFFRCHKIKNSLFLCPINFMAQSEITLSSIWILTKGTWGRLISCAGSDFLLASFINYVALEGFWDFSFSWKKPYKFRYKVRGGKNQKFCVTCFMDEDFLIFLLHS